MGRKLKKLKGLGTIDGDVTDKQQPSLSSRLRLWLSSSPAKYSMHKSNALRALVSVEELHKQGQASSLARNLDECRRERRAYIQRSRIYKENDAIVKLAVVEYQREVQQNGHDMMTATVDKAVKHHTVALEEIINKNQANMEDINMEGEQRLETAAAIQAQEAAVDDVIMEEAINQSMAMLVEVTNDAEHEEHIATGSFQQSAHQQRTAALSEFDELKSLLSGKIADLEAEYDKMREEHEVRNARDMKQYRELIASDAVLASEIRSNMKAIAKIRARFEQLRMANVNFREAEAAQQEALRQRISVMSKAFRRLQTSVAYWKRASESQVKELSLIAFQERTKMKGFVSKTARILKRWAVASKLDTFEKPGETFDKRALRRKWELHLLKQQLLQARERHQNLLGELNRTAFESGILLQKVIQVRDLVAAFGAEGARREMIKSRSCML